MTDDEKEEIKSGSDEDFLRRKKAKEEALMRYINEQNEEPEDIIPDENKTLKGAVIGFLYTLYLILIHPILSDKNLRKRIMMKMLFIVIIILLASWFSPTLKHELNKADTKAAQAIADIPEADKAY